MTEKKKLPQEVTLSPSNTYQVHTFVCICTCVCAHANTHRHTDFNFFKKNQANKQNQLYPKIIFCSHLSLTIPVIGMFAKYMFMNGHLTQTQIINVFQVPV